MLLQKTNLFGFQQIHSTMHKSPIFLFQTNTVNFLQRHIFGPESRTPAISGCANANEPEVEEEKEEFVREHDLTNDEINSMLDVLDCNAFEIRGNDFSIRGKNKSFIGLVLTLKITIVCSNVLRGWAGWALAYPEFWFFS